MIEIYSKKLINICKNKNKDFDYKFLFYVILIITTMCLSILIPLN